MYFSGPLLPCHTFGGHPLNQTCCNSTVIYEPTLLRCRNFQCFSKFPEAPPSPYDHTLLRFAGRRGVRWKRGSPHRAVMWDAGESQEPAAFVLRPTGASPLDFHHFLLAQTGSMCVRPDSWFGGGSGVCHDLTESGIFPRSYIVLN